MSFSSLGLEARLLRAVEQAGYKEPTPIQSQAIPVILTGGDVIAAAQTGTGKTAGFVLPLLHRLQAGKRPGRAPRALVLTPTRELAAQVCDAVATYGRFCELRACAIFGGVNINGQKKALQQGTDILVATPGRLLDLVGQRCVDLSHIETLVLDEADRMLDMGFIRDIRKLLAVLPKHKQALLFSATFSSEIRALAADLLHSPVAIDVAPRNTPVEAIHQRVLHVEKARKRELLAHLIAERDWRQVLVFSRTKHGANRLAEQLSKDGISAAAIHGNKSQNHRTRVLANFKSGDLRVLVATDIASRGIDIDQLPQVVNFELPNQPEDYVHRIGRTARAGRKGEAVSLVMPEEADSLRGIEKLIGRRIETIEVEGFTRKPSSAPPRKALAAANKNPRQRRRRGSAAVRAA